MLSTGPLARRDGWVHAHGQINRCGRPQTRTGKGGMKRRGEQDKEKHSRQKTPCPADTSIGIVRCSSCPFRLPPCHMPYAIPFSPRLDRIVINPGSLASSLPPPDDDDDDDDKSISGCPRAQWKGWRPDCFAKHSAASQ